MDKLSRISVIVAASGLLLAGCGATAQSTVAPTAGGTVVNAAGNARVITPDMKDKTVNVKVGDTLEIQIPTIPTAGMNWEAENLDSTILAQVGDAVYKADADPNSAGGIVTINFKVIGAGTTPLTLIYAGQAGAGGLSLSSNSFGVTIVAK